MKMKKKKSVPPQKELSPLNPLDLCRLCLSEGLLYTNSTKKSKTASSIDNFDMLFRDILQIEVPHLESLPNNVCMNCSTVLNFVDKFKECVKSNQVELTEEQNAHNIIANIEQANGRNTGDFVRLDTAGKIIILKRQSPWKLNVFKELLRLCEDTAVPNNRPLTRFSSKMSKRKRPRVIQKPGKRARRSSMNLGEIKKETAPSDDDSMFADEALSGIEFQTVSDEHSDSFEYPNSEFNNEDVSKKCEYVPPADDCKNPFKINLNLRMSTRSRLNLKSEHGMSGTHNEAEKSESENRPETAPNTSVENASHRLIKIKVPAAYKQDKSGDSIDDNSDASSAPNLLRSFKPDVLDSLEAQITSSNKKYFPDILSIIFHSDTSAYWKCQICTDTFVDSAALKEHWNLDHSMMGECLFPCDLCEVYSPENKYVKHWVTHFYAFMCEKCGKPFGSRSSMKLHMDVHQSDLKFACEICDRRFKKQIYLKNHQFIHAPEEFKDMKKSVCPVCGIKVRCLGDHLETHDESKPLHRCDKCGRLFRDKSNLKQHQATHNDDRPKHKCEICGMMIVKIKFCIDSHMRIHSGEKRFECDQCQMKFYSNSALLSHTRRHSDERRYECKVCSKKFKRTQDLQTHESMHSNDVKYSCPLCSRKIRVEANFRAHLKIHQKKGEFSGSITNLIQEQRQTMREKRQQITVEVDLPPAGPDLQSELVTPRQPVPPEHCLGEPVMTSQSGIETIMTSSSSMLEGGTLAMNMVQGQIMTPLPLTQAHVSLEDVHILQNQAGETFHLVSSQAGHGLSNVTTINVLHHPQFISSSGGNILQSQYLEMQRLTENSELQSECRENGDVPQNLVLTSDISQTVSSSQTYTHLIAYNVPSTL